MDSLSMSPTVVQNIPVLGRKLPLGGLYNVFTGKVADNPVSGDSYHSDKSVKRENTTIIDASEKFDQLHITKQEHLDILMGIVPLTGSSKVLLVDDDNSVDRVLLISTWVAEKSSVDDTYCPGEDSTFTHRVISAVYGVRVVFLFEAPKSKKKQPKLIELVEKLKKIKSLKDRIGLYWLDYRERELSKNITCQIYSDIPLAHSTANLTATEVVELYQRLPQIVVGADPVPLSVEISQIGRIPGAPLPVEIVERLVEFLLSLQAFKKTCSILLDRASSLKFDTLSKKISLYRQIVDLYQTNIVPQLRHDIIQFKEGNLVLQHIKDFLDEMDNSPFHMNVGYQDVLQDWLNQQKQFIGTIDRLYCGKRKTRVQFVKPEDVVTAIANAGETYAVFYVGVTAEDKEHLINMVDYGAGWISSELDESVRALHVYSGSTSSMKAKLMDFATLSDTSKAVFIVSEEIDESQIAGHIKIYKDGETLCNNFTFPAKLDEPTFANISHDKFTVVLNENEATVDEFQVMLSPRHYGETKTKMVKGDSKQVTFEGLTSGTVYRVKVRCQTLLGPFPFSPEAVVITGPGDRPGIPHGMQVSSTGCVIQWPRPKGNIADAYRAKNSGLYWEIEIVWDNERKIETVSGEGFQHHVTLEAGTTYRFRIKAIFRVIFLGKAHMSETDFSDLSEPFDLSASPLQIAKNRSLLSSYVVKYGVPSIHQLKMKSEYSDGYHRLRRLSYGPSNSTKPMKTILVVGATGAGKSTLINAFVNYVLGVQFEDNHRFRIIEENLQSNQSVSQTKWVTAYVLYHQATFPKELPYSLTIVDTPGFGDTSGIQADKEITDQLSEYFHARGHEGIDTLDAVGFVVQASLPRLTPTQQYIFDSILALFGHDVKDNIFVLVTFADGQKAPVMSALDAAKLPYTKSFKFNNSALYAERSSEAKDSDDSDSDDEQSFDKNFWTMGAASYKKFLLNLSKTEPRSLALTNQVLDERQRLETHVSGIQGQITIGLTKQDNLRAGLDCLQQHQVDIDRNKDFEFDVTTTKMVAIALPRGHHVTNCLTCNMTCHYPCGIPANENKHGCAAMTVNRGQNSSCGVCTGGCHWSVHRNTPERLEMQTVTERQTVSQMKKEYEDASQQQLSTEGLILKIIDDVEAQETATAFLVEEVRTSLQKLSMIALKPNHMTTVGYIDTLIESEKQQGLNGWRMRVRQLEAVRDRAETTRRVANYHGIKEPWNDMRNAIQARRHEKGGMINVIKDWMTHTYLSVFRRN